jgi:hypothetical protein
MVRLLAQLDHLDLEQVRRTGELARRGLEALAREYREIVKGVRGAGVMLAFDVVRGDLREALLDRAFRRGLVLLPAGERTVRFYPRYDTAVSAIDDALSILRAALEDFAGGSSAPDPAALARHSAEGATAAAPKIRVGLLDMPLETIETLTLGPAEFEANKLQILTVEQERYGAGAAYPSDVLRAGRRPLVQFPLETLEATMANPRAIGVALRDRVSGRLVGYALGSALENHDEEGVSADPHYGDNNTFFLQAMATQPTVRNAAELETHLLESIRNRAIAEGFVFLSTLIEDRVRLDGPPWLAGATVLERIDNYLRSGIEFVYLQAAL